MKNGSGSKKVVRVRLSDVKMTGLNPEAREKKPALKGISGAFEKTGVLVPIILNQDYQIISGHRRYHVAVEHGHTEIDAIIVDDEGNPAALMGLFDASIRSWKGREWLDLWVKSDGKSAEHTPKVSKRLIEESSKILGGMRGLRYLIEHGAAPNVGRIVVKAYTYIATEYPAVVEFLCDGDDIARQREMIHWAVENRGVQILHRVVADRMLNKPRAVKLAKRIRDAKPITMADLCSGGPAV